MTRGASTDRLDIAELVAIARDLRETRDRLEAIDRLQNAELVEVRGSQYLEAGTFYVVDMAQLPFWTRQNAVYVITAPADEPRVRALIDEIRNAERDAPKTGVTRRTKTEE